MKLFIFTLEMYILQEADASLLNLSIHYLSEVWQVYKCCPFLSPNIKKSRHLSLAESEIALQKHTKRSQQKKKHLLSLPSLDED